MSSNVVATITPDGYVSVQNGPFTKNISIKDFAAAISTLVAEEDQVLDQTSFRYPSSIHSVTKTNQGYTVNLYYPECVKTLRHTSAGRKTMYMPNVMIRVTLKEIQGRTNNFSLGDIYWYATDKDRIALGTDWPRGGSSRDHIWTLPFPNVYGDARMCTGGNRLPSVIYQDWTVLDMLYEDVLCGSPFNNDLGVRSISESMNPSQWFNFLGDHYEQEDTERFPYDKLVNY